LHQSDSARALKQKSMKMSSHKALILPCFGGSTTDELKDCCLWSVVFTKSSVLSQKLEIASRMKYLMWVADHI